jgi:FkbM family methyltransferase
MSVGSHRVLEAHEPREGHRRYSTLELEYSPVDGFLKRVSSKVSWQVLCQVVPGRKLSVKLASGQSFAEGSLRKSDRYDALSVVQVKTVSIDDYVHEHGIQRVDLIKIDVEGAEYEAFQGATKLLVAPHLTVVSQTASAISGWSFCLGGRPRRLGGTQAGRGTW